MLFNSFAYGLFFLIVFTCYWLMPNRFKWIWLLTVSLFFYLCFKPVYIVLLIAISFVTYITAIFIDSSIEKCSDIQNNKKRKIYLVLGLAFCLSLLFIFKYYNFASSSICSIFETIGIKLSASAVKLALPVGISFYTFQTLGYLIDVYRGKISSEKHFGHYLLFVSFFPQIASGPIGRADSLMPQLRGNVEFDRNKASEGALLILWGFYKKLVVADTLSVNVDLVFNNPGAYKGGACLIAAIFYSIQIYCDFSGYSDIAIGSAKLLGIDLMENFRSPYLSSSVKEFWGRWHISLSTWFRDYVYIPLGGNRCSKLRRDLNLMITFLVSGLWHGANWTFIFWGGIHGMGQIIENHIPFLAKSQKRSTNVSTKIKIMDGFVLFLRMAFVFMFATLAWVFFRAATIADGISIIRGIFESNGSVVNYFATGFGDVRILGNVRLFYIFLIIAILVITDIINYKGKLTQKVMSLPLVMRWIVIILFATITVLFAQKGVAAEFVYLQF